MANVSYLTFWLHNGGNEQSVLNIHALDNQNEIDYLKKKIFNQKEKENKYIHIHIHMDT